MSMVSPLLGAHVSLLDVLLKLFVEASNIADKGKKGTGGCILAYREIGQYRAAWR